MFTAAGKSAAVSAANYIEDVFSTYLYTGNGSTQTITNGIDLSGKGGLVWIKDRAGTYSGQAHQLTDTVRGYNSQLSSNSTGSASSNTNYVSSFSSTGFVLGNSSSVNGTSTTWASWTFRKQAKFFDIVTYTGNGTAGRTIAHNLGSVPGCVITKKTNSTSNWAVYHRGITSSENGAILLNSSDAWVSSSAVWNNTAPTSTNFTVGTADATNINGETYVAYLFAHDAGGFGASGTDNVISCGSFTTSAGGTATVTLGYEPQFLLVKTSAVTGSWQMIDIMRGMPVGSACRDLAANSSAAEGTGYTYSPTATGFTFATEASRTYIYIAIRRGPMKTPTSGTTVYSPVARTGTGAAASISSVPFPPDWIMFGPRSIADNKYEIDRLRGVGEGLITNSNNIGVGLGASLTLNINGVSFADGNSAWNQNAVTYVNWFLGRAPGFLDIVCYTGTGSTRTVTHNLGVAPELVLYKARDFTADWNVYAQPITASNFLSLNTTAAQNSSVASLWNGIAPTSTNLTVVSNNGINGSGLNYVAYLFATCPGVSKVGSYTGTGALQTINCGFAAGARYVLIKRTDSTGAWYVYDSARGISSGNDPYLLLNSNAAEIANTNYVDTASTGFQVTAAAPADLNANGGTYLFLAIA